MAVTIYHEQDANPELIQGKKIAVIGYGSQGHAHALNLKDSGCDVRVGLREGSKSWQAAEEAGLKVMTVADAAKEADLHHDPRSRREAGRDLRAEHRS